MLCYYTKVIQLVEACMNWIAIFHKGWINILGFINIFIFIKLLKKDHDTIHMIIKVYQLKVFSW